MSAPTPPAPAAAPVPPVAEALPTLAQIVGKANPNVRFASGGKVRLTDYVCLLACFLDHAEPRGKAPS